MKCNNCDCQTDLFFCPKCGTIIEYPSFVKGKKAMERLQSYLKSMVSEANKLEATFKDKTDKLDISNTVYRTYFEHLAYLQELCTSKATNDYFNGSGDNLFERMNSFASKCKNEECQIAIVGTVKAGKSAFLNALLGKEIASSYPTPETASLTKFKESKDGNYVEVCFYNDREWEELWDSVQRAKERVEREDKEDFMSVYERLNAESLKSEYLNAPAKRIKVNDEEELKKYVDIFTSARYPEHFFAKEVTIGLSDYFAGSNVVFVDTPGLNDPVRYRVDITKKYLNSANVILICVSADNSALRYEEVKQLGMIFAQLRYAKDRIYVFGTQIDKQGVGYREKWIQHTLPEWVKFMKDDDIFGSAEKAQDRVNPSTAWYYLLINKAKNNVNLWEDGKLGPELDELVRRNIKCPKMEELVKQYGLEEGYKKYKSPQDLFYENIEELYEMTNIPKIRKMLLCEPIYKAQDIIKKDIKEEYLDICSIVKQVAQDVSELNLESIGKQDKEKEEEILDLTNRINEETSYIKQLEPSIHQALIDLQEVMNEVVNSIK